MRQVFLIFSMFLAPSAISMTCGFSQSGLPKPETGVRDSRGTIHLFNHQNLDGWYTFIKDRGRNSDPKGVFSVQDNTLRVSGEEWGCITTNETFENYKLVLEYKWGEKTYGERSNRARDNGILFHSTGADGTYSGTWMHSIECNIIEGGTGDFIIVDGQKIGDYSITTSVAPERNRGYTFKPGGKIVTVNDGINWYGRDPNWKDEKGFRGKDDVEHPAGEWNRLECIARGNELSIYLNGVLVNHALYTNPASGRIQIQSEGAEIFYRRVDLIPLPPSFVYVPEDYKPLFNGKDLSGWTIHGTEKWYVDNGELICESGPEKKYGYLSTKKPYKNFILQVDFKQEADGNSGIFFRSSIKGTKINGWQVEVAPPGLHSGGVYESYGREWLVMPDADGEKALRQMGEWNHMRIEVNGDVVTTWLNGKRMIYFKDRIIGEGDGFIALQIHSGGGIKLRWKNLYIREL